MIYLDNASSTKVNPTVLEEMLVYIRENYGNASSLHSLGCKCRNAIETARNQVATAIGAEPNQIFFVNSATEGNNWIISNYNKVLCSKVEHHSILNNPKCITMDRDKTLAKQIYIEKPDLVTKMMVCNETGEIYNIKPMIDTCHKMKIPFHTDATQAFSHIPVNVKELNVDSLVMSGHKFHAYGCGIVYLKDPSKYKPLLYGGGQEKGLRSSTENVASIVGIGKACELYNYSEGRDTYIQSLKNHLSNFIQENIPDFRINAENFTVSNILNVSFKGIEGESLMLMLDRAGICVSSGSACNSGSLEPSHVLKDMGVPDDYIYGTIRFSFSEYNTLDEIIETEKVLKETVKKLRGN